MKLFTQNQISKVKFSALFVFTFLMANAQAFSGSSLRLLLPPTGEHTVVIDNMPFNGVYDRFKINDLRAGNHRLKIVQLIVSRRGIVVDRIVVYNGMIFIPKNSKVWAKVSPNGRLRIERTYQYYDDRNRGNRNRGYNNRDYQNYRDGSQNDGGNGNRMKDDYYDEDWYGYNDQGQDDQDDYSQRRDGRDNSGYDNRNGNDRRNGNGNNSLSREQTFQLTLSAIQKQSFDTERLKIAKNAVSQGNMLSSEIAEIAKLFSFESTKLDFAKYAYAYTSDKQNYVLVQNAFQFSSSTSELQDFIAQYKGH
jgi:hypothetical protein